MPYIQCAGCGQALEINIVERDCWNTPRVDSNPSKVVGSATCRNCNTGTGFEIMEGKRVLHKSDKFNHLYCVCFTAQKYRLNPSM
jgi:hypothetical protein